MSTEPSGGDLTPIAGAQTDVAPLGRSGPVPAHEQTAGATPALPWELIASHPDFRQLLEAKKKFILPTTVFFLAYFFALPILVGWFPELMKTKVGAVNFAYLFALSQFFMAWIVAAIYVGKASGWDKSAEALIARFKP